MNKDHTKYVKSWGHFRLWMSVILIIMSFNIYAGTISKSIELTFSEKEFTLRENSIGEWEIESNTHCVYPNSEEPCLPLISHDLAIKGSYAYNSVIVSYEKRELMTNIQLASSPLPVTTDMEMSSGNALVHSYADDQQYPLSNCRYVSTSNWEIVNVLHFLITPFIYDALDKKLYFIDSMKVNIELKEHLPVSGATQLNKIDTSILRSFVTNAEELEELTDSYSDLKPLNMEDQIDYVVVTNEALAPCFKPLCQWKTEKGVRAKIITIEYIKSNYSGKDTQLKIKNCLNDLYSNHNLKYVLLGGDDTIVPVRGCYGYVKSATQGDFIYNDIPTDMYYACFNDCFDWDKNGNGIYGEVDDNIDLTQKIYISRLPIRSSDDVNYYVNKLFEYERNPKYNNNILMCGMHMFGNASVPSDMELKGDKLYEKYILPYWDGHRYKFYDTATDFIGGEAYDFSSNNLKYQIEQGYSFMEVLTHGSQTTWAMEKKEDKYNSYSGANQKNKTQTIITTIACSTNAFDSSGKNITDPCLSESFIRNPNSGVVAYLGCSRESWGTSSSQFGSSLKYESSFYEKLFSKYIYNNSFAAVVTAAKASYASSCYTNSPMRWLQFGLNPVGDPEMPIWIAEPKKFDDIKIVFNESCITFDSSEDNCRICIVDDISHGENYFNVWDDIRKVSISDLPEKSSICFTKPGFIPKQIKMDILQNRTISNDCTFSNDKIICGSSLTTSQTQGSFVIKTGKVTMMATTVFLGPGSKIEKGAQLVIINK